MKKRTKLAVGAGTALAVVGTGAAIGATKLTPREESTAVLEDAAKQLGVEPAKLADALEQALENRIDAAVAEGRLPAEMAERLKQRLEAKEFPLLTGPLFGHGSHFGVRGGTVDLGAAAAYLGLEQAELRAALREGTTLAQVAKDENKPVGGLVDALVAAATERLDRAVADGRLSQAQRDARVAGLKERVTDAVDGVRPAFDRGRGHSGFGFRGHHAPEPPPPAA